MHSGGLQSGDIQSRAIEIWSRNSPVLGFYSPGVYNLGVYSLVVSSGDQLIEIARYICAAYMCSAQKGNSERSTLKSNIQDLFLKKALLIYIWKKHS